MLIPITPKVIIPKVMIIPKVIIFENNHTEVLLEIAHE